MAWFGGGAVNGDEGDAYFSSMLDSPDAAIGGTLDWRLWLDGGAGLGGGVRGIYFFSFRSKEFALRFGCGRSGLGVV